ncbi:MAG: PP0621 family protein [Rhodoferax sp.]|nr:PP0621 family protein [Rhodoferax sp.]
MKLLMWLLIALWIVWLWRTRSSKNETPAPPPSATAKPVDLEACAYCGLLTSDADKVPGAKARYCCAAHRDLAER